MRRGSLWIYRVLEGSEGGELGGESERRESQSGEMSLLRLFVLSLFVLSRILIALAFENILARSPDPDSTRICYFAQAASSRLRARLAQ
jgi:hypothetical protein